VLLQNYYEMDIRVRRKVEALVSVGYNVDILALRSSYSKSREYKLDGANVYTFSLNKRRGGIARYYFEYVAFFFWALFKLSRLMKQKSYSVIDVNNLPDILVFAAFHARWKGAKILFDMHEITPEFFMSKYGVGEGHWQVRLARLLEKASCSFADHVMTINEPIRILLESRGLPLAKSTVIMNSVDESMFTSSTAAGGVHSPRNKATPFIMMYHGTFTHIYGLDIALEAFALACNDMPGAELRLMGSGPEKSALEKLAISKGIGARVHFLPMVLPQEVPMWLSECDVGLLPTRRDVFLDLSFSNKLSEYIICGKPVIASRLKSFCYYFSENALVYFEPNSKEDLARQMLRLYTDPELRSSIPERAKQEYEPISWSVMRRRFLDMMQELTRGQAKS
jgi:glycosyltransferase involved in cell wall biosynthesis